MEAENTNSQRIGMIVSIALHVIFLLLAIFSVSCWASKGPPSGDQIGFEVNHGDLTGQDNLVETEVESVETEVREPVEEIKEVSEVQPQEIVEESIEESFDNEAPVSHTIEKVEAKKTEKKPTETKKEQQKAVYTPAKSTGTTETVKGKQGDPNSTKTVENAYTTPGGGGGGKGDGGFALSLQGWKWDAPPNAQKIKHTGEVEFTFVITEDAEVLDIQIIKSSFTPAETEILKEKLYSTVFFQTSNGAPPAQTKGRLIWKIIAK